jgi:hypothetical protein
MIYCVWYPSGGFGHFVNAVLTMHGKNFVRPLKSLEFSKNGNSHNLDLVVPKYLHECWPGGIEFLDNKNYCVLIDNGITNESDTFRSVFPGATVIKICYSDWSWPIVARTMIDKAMNSSIKEQLPINNWNSDEPWATREKYFLFLREHNLRFAWRPPALDSVEHILIDNLIVNYFTCFNMLDRVAELSAFEDVWTKWRVANTQYIDPVDTANLILSSVISKVPRDISHVTDIWAQSVVYYYIWLKYNFEVLHNDYSNWFTNTADIVKMLDKHGVNH